MEYLLERRGVRIALFAFVVAVLGGLSLWLLMRSDEPPTPAQRPGGATAPTPAPTWTPGPTEVAQQRLDVEAYLMDYYTYGWQTDLEAWEAKLAEHTAKGVALTPPFEGASLATCVRIQCRYTNPTVRDLVGPVDGVYRAHVEATFLRGDGGPEGRNSWTCEVRTSGPEVTGLSCVGGEGGEGSAPKPSPKPSVTPSPSSRP